ncbi:MAG TPA: SH3 domain-containing protein [Xanthobacteraceae bacterium]|jgi:hypothetical protein
MTFKSKLLTGAGLLVLSTGFALAAPAVVQESVNLRAGPGVEYPVVTAMPQGAPIDVMGCEGTWCRVAFGRTVGFASREFLALGGRIGPRGPGYATYGEDDEYGYAPGESYSEGVTTGYSRGYGYGADVRGGADFRTREGVGAEADIRTREGVRTGADARIREGARTGADVRTESRGARAGANATNGSRTDAQTRTVLQGNNPMKDYGTSHNPNLRAEGHATALKGNNPMRVRESTSNPNLRSSQAPTAIKGNNPMKVPDRSAAMNEGKNRPSETTGAASREDRR